MCFTCRMCKRKSATVTPANIESSHLGQVTSMDLDVLTIEEELKIPEKGGRTNREVSIMKDTPPTWQDISLLVDISSFLFFAIFSILSFTIFMI